MAKIIDVKDGYAISFEQRARGHETPYWIGTVYKDGLVVGSFENNGNGGMTFINPWPVRDALAALVNAAAGEKVFEAEGVVIAYAETMGYGRRGKPASFDVFVREWVRLLGEVES